MFCWYVILKNDNIFFVVAACVWWQVFEGLPDGFSEDQDTVVRYMKLLPPVFSDEDRRAEAARVKSLAMVVANVFRGYGRRYSSSVITINTVKDCGVCLLLCRV